MPAKRRKIVSMQEVTQPRAATLEDGSKNSSHEDASNENRGLLCLPYELWGEIFSSLNGIDTFTQAPRHWSYLDYPVLPVLYLEKTDVLRILCQVSVAYRRNFLPFLWYSLSACCAARPGPDVKPMMFFRHVAETLVSKCEGLSRNPELAALVRCVQLALTRYQSASVIPTLASTLARLPNAHTLHILHAHTQMTTALKDGFQGISLPQIRTVIVPGYCHEILRCCPGTKTVWCTEEDGSKLVTVIGSHCKEVVELRGVLFDDTKAKRIVKAVPNLEVIEIMPYEAEVFLTHLTAFKNFRCLILKDVRSFNQDEDKGKIQLHHWEHTLRSCAAALKKLPPFKDGRKRSLRIAHTRSIAGKGGPRPVEYTEVDLAG
ncbi:hypothetical protein CPB83DRAFT_848367 [Crepidotus variabilis]|uniref:Uncharacterized protein n=1 Tax=Crepidotus variabilis TaxID=179855 RepID=A0A9P6JSM4_9AGAR|nr:hypothetical protein CPB83DRAFT_848367 [Crepidotus variabilis]